MSARSTIAIATALWAAFFVSPVWAQNVPPPKIGTASAQASQAAPAPQAEPDWRALLQQVRSQRDQATQLSQDAQAELMVKTTEAAKSKTEADTANKLLAKANEDKANLAAYLKACGDKVGCTAPAE